MIGTEEMLTVRRSKENGKDETNGEGEINNPTCSKSRDESKKERKKEGIQDPGKKNEIRKKINQIPENIQNFYTN